MGEDDDEYYNFLMEILENKELLKDRKEDDLYEYFWAYWENNKWRDKDGNIVPLDQLQGETTDSDDDGDEESEYEWEYENEEEEDGLDKVWEKISEYHKNIKDKCPEQKADTGAKYYEFSLK